MISGGMRRAQQLLHPGQRFGELADVARINAQ
jgi:hypothetical protein